MFVKDGKYPTLYDESTDLFFPLHDDFKVNGFAVNKLFEDVLNMKNAREYYSKPEVKRGKYDLIIEKKESEDEEDRSSQAQKDVSFSDTSQLIISPEKDVDKKMETSKADNVNDTQFKSTINESQLKSKLSESQVRYNVISNDAFKEGTKNNYKFMKKYFDQYVNRTHKKKKGEVYDASGVERKIGPSTKGGIRHKGARGVIVG